MAKHFRSASQGSFAAQFSEERLADAIAMCERRWDHFEQSSGELPASALRLPHELAELVKKNDPRSPCSPRSPLSLKLMLFMHCLTRGPPTSPLAFNRDIMLLPMSMASGEETKFQRGQCSKAELRLIPSLLLGWSHLARLSSLGLHHPAIGAELHQSWANWTTGCGKLQLYTSLERCCLGKTPLCQITYILHICSSLRNL